MFVVLDISAALMMSAFAGMIDFARGGICWPTRGYVRMYYHRLTTTAGLAETVWPEMIRWLPGATVGLPTIRSSLEVLVMDSPAFQWGMLEDCKSSRPQLRYLCLLRGRCGMR